VKVFSSSSESGLFPLASDLAWQREAACRGLGAGDSQTIFFPSRGDSIEEARAICRECPVTAQCLDFALANGCIGVWGGTTERQRRRLRRSQRTGDAQFV
jgi:WhiB family transcriptional regulator, redox-sensing transcriptional regulator